MAPFADVTVVKIAHTLPHTHEANTLLNKAASVRPNVHANIYMKYAAARGHAKFEHMFRMCFVIAKPGWKQIGTCGVHHASQFEVLRSVSANMCCIQT